MAHERELTAMFGWLDETDRIALEHFSVGVASERKHDGTPVTVADRAIESLLRQAIERDFPADAVLGEEEGASGGGERRWIIDPIDGTASYRRGIPAFATLIALERDGRIVAGAVSAPALGARWWATEGGGAFRDGTRLRVSNVARLDEAEVSSGGVATVRQAGLLDGFLSLSSGAERTRGWGDFWGHVLVAQGSIEIMLDPVVSLWDLAAITIIVTEAGGRMTSAAGEERIDAGSALTTNGLLHDEVLRLLG